MGRIKLIVENKLNMFQFIDRNRFDIIEVKNYDFIIDSNNNLLHKDVFYIKHFLPTPKEVKLANIPIIDISNENKLESLYKLKENGIPVPRFFYVKNLLEYSYLLNDNLNYIIKPIYKTRGIGCKFVDVTEIMDMYNFIENATKEKIDFWEASKNFNKKFDIDTSNIKDNIEKNILLKSIKNNDVFISEKINVSKEYRVVYFKGSDVNKYFIEYRVGYEPNSSEERNRFILKPETFVKHFPDKDILNKFKTLGDNLDYPVVSIDLYITNEDGWGVFDYSTEYDVCYPDRYNEFSNLVTKAYDLHILMIKNKVKPELVL